jgi:hypothetical protein
LEFARDCVYSSNKRERDRELLEKLIIKNKQLESSLKRVMEENTFSTVNAVQETPLVLNLSTPFLSTLI